MRLVITFCVLSMKCNSQTFSGSGGIIADDQITEVEFPIFISSLPPIANSIYGLSKICLNIQHSNVGDLFIQLVSPTGTTAPLIQNIGGASDNFTNTCLEQDAIFPVQNQTGHFTVTYKPQGLIFKFNDSRPMILVRSSSPSIFYPNQHVENTLS